MTGVQVSDLVILVQFIGERKTSIKEFFPKINQPVFKKPRRKMTDDFPSQEYTDPRCMMLIKERDKQANAAYVKEFHDELKKNINLKNRKEFKLFKLLLKLLNK